MEATMKSRVGEQYGPQRPRLQARPPTLAEVCEAIGSGKIAAKIEDGYYTVSQRDLRQLRRPADPAIPWPLRRPRDLAS